MAKAAAKRFAIGVDYGTNSVRALVVDVADGARSGHPRLQLPQRRGGHSAGPQGSAAWPGRTRPITSRASITSVRGGAAAAKQQPGFPPGAGRRHRRRHHRLDAHPGRPRRACRWPCCRSSPTTSRPRPGFGRTIPATPRRPRSPSKARKVAARTWPSAAATYSSEWYWSKILHCKRTVAQGLRGRLHLGRAGRLRPGLLTGNLDPDTLPRGICAAGHKAMYNERWGGLPSAGVPGQSRSGPGRPRATATRRTAVPADHKAGRLTAEVAAQGRACRRASPWPSAPSTPTWARWGRASSPARW